MAAHGYEEDLLRRWFPSVEIDSPNRKAFTERDIREISDILERAKKTSWSRIPRIYIILRLIGKLEAIESFINQDISDTGFPFTQNTLPGVLRDHSDRSQFLSIQKLICNTRALNLERPGIGHGHFPDPSEIPLKKIGDLGKGGSGIVERVISTVSHQEYALKLIRRGTTFRKDKEVLYNYEKELSSLKKLSQSHCHIIDLIGSYTDPKYVGILFPVADCNLAELLDNPIFTNRRGSLRPYFGCLISALAYLHENKIRHKDIKPQNILVKNGDPYFTDFGLSVDWSELSHGTTTGPTAMTPKYGAPEVAACEPRNFSSDIWSLGCVYLEIWNVLKDGSRDAIAAHFTRDGRALPYHSEAVDMRQCLEFIQRIPGPDSDNSPRAWIQHMLERRRDERWSANLIMDSIKELSMDHYSQYLYIGRCCLDDDDSAESVISQSGEASTRDSEAENITSNSRKPSERDRRPYQNRSSYHGPEDLHKNPLPFVKDYYPKINTNGSFTPSHGSTHQPSPGFNDSTTRLQTASDHGSKGGPSFGGHVVSQGPKVEHHNLSYPPGVRLDDYMGIKAVAFSKELLHPYGILRAGHQYKSTWTEWFVFGWMSPVRMYQSQLHSLLICLFSLTAGS